MKTLIILIAVLVMSGCSTGDQSITSTHEMRTRCIDGVVYYQYTETAGYGGYGFMSPKYNRDGTVALCNN